MAAQKELSEKKAQPVDSSHSDKDVKGVTNWEQEFKSLRSYIDGLEHYFTTDVKDAGNYQINLCDKLNAMERKVKQLAAKSSPVEAAQPVSFDSFTDELHLRLEYHISIGNTPRMALTLALADCQYLYPEAQPVDSSHSQDAETFWKENVHQQTKNGFEFLMKDDFMNYAKQVAPITSHSDKDIEELAEIAVPYSNSEPYSEKRELWIKGYKAAQSSPVEAAKETKNEIAVYIKSQMDLFPNNATPSQRAGYDSYLNILNYINNIEEEQPSGKVLDECFHNQTTFNATSGIHKCSTCKKPFY